MTTLSIPRLIKFQDAAEQLGISLRSLRERSWKRQFDHVKIGKERYFTDEQLRAFIDASTVTSARSDELAKTAQRVANRRGKRPAKAAA